MGIVQLGGESPPPPKKKGRSITEREAETPIEKAVGTTNTMADLSLSIRVEGGMGPGAREKGGDVGIPIADLLVFSPIAPTDGTTNSMEGPEVAGGAGQGGEVGGDQGKDTNTDETNKTEVRKSYSGHQLRRLRTTSH